MYKLTRFNSIIRLTDNASIPPDPANVDYAEFLEWVKAGGVPEPADVIEPPAPKGELPKVDDIDALDLTGVKEVIKLLIERAS